MPPAREPARRQPEGIRRREAWQGLVGAAIIAAGLGAGVYLSGTNVSSLFSGDAMTDKEAADRAAAFTAVGPIALAEVPDNERPTAVGGIGLPAEQQATLRRDVEAKQVRLVYLTVWDDRYEDGDAVRIASGGFSRDIALRNAPTRLTIPLQGTAGITVTGLHDGTGGITVGILNGNDRIPLPRMAVGQVITVSVR